MDDRLVVRLLGVLLLALLVGATVWLRLFLGRRRSRRQLESAGATFGEGASSLAVPPSPALISAPAAPRWSATVTREARRFDVYPLKNGFLVVAWRSQRSLPLRFVMRAPPDTGNSRHRDLLPVDITGAYTYGAPPTDVGAFLHGAGAGLFRAFTSSTAGAEGWQLLYDGGACYLVRYLVMEDVERLLQLALVLEEALGQVPAT
jgi:hypothetical protein